MNFEPNFDLIDGIKIYDGTTSFSRIELNKRIVYFQSLIDFDNVLFSDLLPSTLSVRGNMLGVNFHEEELIKKLPKPEGLIQKIGCNFGELFNDNYVTPVKKKLSNRGRKPKKKKKTTRKVTGNGKYFNSQISFDIKHPNENLIYKIKVFRTGSVQVPGVRNPNICDLVEPFKLLKTYLEIALEHQIQIEYFTSIMRNYKSALSNEHYRVDLEKLEKIISAEKNDKKYTKFLQHVVQHAGPHQQILDYLGNYNPMKIAEMSYNTDKCFCLIIKLYRPSILDKGKKTTIKLLKKGKVNFDGGNSQQEIIELYYWIQCVYQKHLSVLHDISKITDCSPSSCSEDSIYDADTSKPYVEKDPITLLSNVSSNISKYK